MGCTSSDTTTENTAPPVPQRNDFVETKEEENIKKQVNQKQNDIIDESKLISNNLLKNLESYTLKLPLDDV